MNFEELNINKPLLNALNDLGFTKPTTIQEKAFPVVMSGRDVVGIAQTGTGKTIAFLLPCLRQWKFTTERNPQILILVPTRELVVQVVENVEKLTQYMNVTVVGVYGGANIKTQAEQVQQGLDVIVATPGRLIDLVLFGALKLKDIKKFVIDEIDEIFEQGFRFQITRILDMLPAKRQNLLFSATITDEVEQLIEEFFNSPIRIEATPVGTPLANITQVAYNVPNFFTKVNLLEWLLADKEEMKKVLVFCSTKKMADDMYERVEAMFGDEIGLIHSGKAQNFRFRMVNGFQSGEIRVLIATDIIARGLDISEVSHVINFDMPDDPETYIHRIGRTGRLDKKGNAISMFTPRDMEVRAQIEALMNLEIPNEEISEDVEISTVLTEHENPKNQTKNIVLKLPKRDLTASAFHEKLDKNKKVNNKIRKKKAMQIKYGKPKTRGAKIKPKR